ncbi:hypothetical protein ACFWUZ_22730 [Streptomyces sp. NPDC058646]|uniref:hypothetical protein n=1 Tax=Streptomyces sp. NPDC058646 TaxID=3346574 RepID=UPI00365AF988
MNDAVEARGPQLPPSHPPKSPPPQKKPVEAPRPQPATKPKGMVGQGRMRMAVRNRRTAALTHRSDPWAARKTTAKALSVVRGWGYPRLDAADLEKVVHRLVSTAVADGGRRVSIHLADQDQRILVMVLSHHAADGSGVEAVLGELAAVRSVVGCGADTGEDGRRLWALLDTDPAPQRAPRAD